jgi:hypothetical protein
MHSSAYIDEAVGAIRYQELSFGNGAVARSRVLESTAGERALTPAEMRARNMTRKAAVHGRVVQFMRLSPGCRVTPVWDTFWHLEYETEERAEFAAATWARCLKIIEPRLKRGEQ